MWRSIAYAVALRAATAALADVGGGGEPTAAGATTAAGAAAGGTTATAGGVMDPAIGGRGTEECWDRDVFCDFCDGCDCCELGRQGLQKNAAQTRSVFREFYTTPAYASFLACAELSPEALQRALDAHATNLTAAAARGGPRALPHELVFIVGFGGSGTTLLARLLSAHPDVYVGMEHKLANVFLRARERYAMEELTMSLTGGAALAADAALAGLLAQLLADSWATEASGKRVRGLKLFDAASVGRLARAFPEARFLHIVRDGRAAAASVARKSSSWANLVNGSALGAIPLEAALRSWAALERALEYEAPLLGDRYAKIAFEDLVRSPDVTLLRVCRLLGVPFQEEILRPAAAPRREPLVENARRFEDGVLPATWMDQCEHGVWAPRAIDREAADAWRRTWSPEDDARVQPLVWDVLREAGYVTA